MSNPRAIEGSSGAFGSGRPTLELDGVATGEGSGGGKRGLTSWLGRFTQGQVATNRRNSVGFDANVGIAPLTSMDEDSNSIDNLTLESSKHIPFGRKRDFSFSDIQTPGGDGDTFILNYKRKPSIDYASSNSPGNHFTFPTNGVGGSITLELDKTSPKDSFTTLNTIPEARMAILNVEDASVSDTFNQMGIGGGGKLELPSPTDEAGELLMQDKNSSSIFLIDLETETDGKSVKLVPKTKKFALSNVLQKEWAQNWFFRNDSVHDDNAMTGVEADDKTSGDNKERDSQGGKQHQEEEELIPENSRKPTFVGKIMKLVEDNPAKYREMNTWQPQSQ